MTPGWPTPIGAADFCERCTRVRYPLTRDAETGILVCNRCADAERITVTPDRTCERCTRASRVVYATRTGQRCEGCLHIESDKRAN